MTFPAAVRTTLTKYVDFSGRAGRSEYWWFALFQFVLVLVADVADNLLSLGFLNTLVSLGLLLPGLAVTVRRLHDTNRSAWWLLGFVIAYVAAFAVFLGALVMVLGSLFSESGTEHHVPASLIGVGIVLLLGGIGLLAAVAITGIVLMCLSGTPGPNRYGPPPGQQPVDPAPGPGGYGPQHGTGPTWADYGPGRNQ